MSLAVTFFLNSLRRHIDPKFSEGFSVRVVTDANLSFCPCNPFFSFGRTDPFFR